MTAKSDELVNELVSAAIAFGRGVAPDWQTRIEDARVKLCEYIDEVEGLEEDSGSYDSLIPDWANEPKQRWIPVSERLPELDQDVLAIVEDCIAIGHFYEEWGGDVYFSWDDVGAMQVATHWMPLPELPESTHDR